MADLSSDRYTNLGPSRGSTPYRSRSSVDVGHSPMSSRDPSHVDLKSLENGGFGYGYATHSAYGEGMPDFPLSTGGSFFAHQYPASSNGETPNISRSPSVVFPSGIAGASSGLLERRRTSGNVEQLSRSGQTERWGAGTGWRSRMTLIWGMRFGWIVMVIWCEVGEFFHSVSGCRFPDSKVSTAHLRDLPKEERSTYPTHVVLLADPQIPHPTLSYPSRNQVLQKISTWFIDLYMRKSWDVLKRLGRIDAVIMAGDMMDWGRGVFDEEECVQS